MNSSQSETAKYQLKTNEADARERLRAFWAGESLGRPALGVHVRNTGFEPPSPPWDAAQSPMPHVSPWVNPPELPGRPKKSFDLDPAWHQWITEVTLEHHHYLGESIPHVLPKFGTHLWLVACVIGADYEWEAGSTWVAREPDVLERDLPGFRKDHPTIARLTECIRASAEVAGQRGYISPPALLDGLTTLSSMRGEEELLMLLLDEPDAVKRWVHDFTSVAIDTHKYFQGLCEELGYGENSTWFPVTAEGPMEAVQCDTALMLSPDMFREFVSPDLGRFVEYFDFSLYHLDGNAQRRHFDNLSALPRLNGIQWNPEPGDSDPYNHLDLFREIRERGWNLFIQDIHLTVESAAWLTRELGPDGLFLALPLFETHAEADAAIETIEKAVK